MDITTVLIFFVAGLLALGLVAFMLNRAWGDFPTRISPPDPTLGTRSRLPRQPAASAQQLDRTELDEDLRVEDDELPAGAPTADTIVITNPQIREAAVRALERGGTPFSTYFFRDGDQVYFAAYRIADPLQRAQAVKLFQGLNSHDPKGLDFTEIIGLMRQLGK
jgi:hypothetical protein